MATHRRIRLTFGLLLVLLGGGMLWLQANPQVQESLQRYYEWPFNFFLLGGLLVVLAIALDAPGMVIGGSIVAGLGGIFYYQSVTNDYESWAYLWTLIPGFVGIGTLLTALFWSEKRRYHFRRGINLLVTSAVLLLVFGSLLGAFDLFGSYGPAVILILLGLYLVGRSFTGEKA